MHIQIELVNYRLKIRVDQSSNGRWINTLAPFMQEAGKLSRWHHSCRKQVNYHDGIIHAGSRYDELGHDPVDLRIVHRSAKDPAEKVALVRGAGFEKHLRDRIVFNA
jgi:hypothetical protein